MAPAEQTPGGERSPSIAVVSAVDLLLQPSASRVNGLRSLRHGRRRVLIGIMVDDDGDEVERAAVSFCLRGSRPKRRITTSATKPCCCTRSYAACKRWGKRIAKPLANNRAFPLPAFPNY
jgi:hypothetical protein